VQSWLAPGADRVTSAAVAAKTGADFAHTLYRGILGREATPEEIAEAEALVARRPKDRLAVAKDLAWALIASAEFRSNH
jgi:hypothetical protein